MTVRELQERLAEQPPDLPVCVTATDGSDFIGEVTGVVGVVRGPHDIVVLRAVTDGEE